MNEYNKLLTIIMKYYFSRDLHTLQTGLRLDEKKN